MTFELYKHFRESIFLGSLTAGFDLSSKAGKNTF